MIVKTADRRGGLTRAGVAALLMVLGAGCRSTPPPLPDTPAPAAAAAPVGNTPAGAVPPQAPGPGPGTDDGLGRPAGKRVGPADVPPVTVGGITYRVVHWGKERGLEQNGGYVEAIGGAGQSLWVVKVYSVRHDSAMEDDVQDVFITALSVAPQTDSLAVTDERGGQYLIDTRTRGVRVVRPRGQ